ncbi:phosphoribosylglycinamide formyltransferase [Thioalkalivibrio sp. XN279]|uniref:phosphoribosylglycinamide formyltransferase n=1 Tax=Thioalkalivibrio sp. XN279 TaxID=2714953 RepID=UPI001409D12E|nr:phosphoribosylglycinamide formyltransferase [Thioalkalivibrio sp. XN279]NHA14817.1 phosphoribosylglycinamide formyltransferase [Thioalkalivibrio sp. XN279]
MPRPALPVAVLVSGYGSNLQALLDARAAGRLPVDFRLVASDRPEAQGLARARRAGVRAEAVAPGASADRAAWNEALGALLADSGAELVVLAGFMRVLAPELVRAWEGRMLNIHPSLLPRHRGLHTHRRALEAGDRMHGTSIHFVTEELDGGPVVLQARLPVLPGDDPEGLARRVQAREHDVYPRVVRWAAEGWLQWRAGRPWLYDRPLHRPVVV